MALTSDNTFSHLASSPSFDASLNSNSCYYFCYSSSSSL